MTIFFSPQFLVKWIGYFLQLSPFLYIEFVAADGDRFTATSSALSAILYIYKLLAFTGFPKNDIRMPTHSSPATALS